MICVTITNYRFFSPYKTAEDSMHGVLSTFSVYIHYWQHDHLRYRSPAVRTSIVQEPAVSSQTLESKNLL